MAKGKREICEPTGKVIYKRHQAAAAVVGYFKRKATSGAASAPLSIYRCSHCRRWHLTSYSPERTRAIQQKRRQHSPKANQKVNDADDQQETQGR